MMERRINETSSVTLFPAEVIYSIIFLIFSITVIIISWYAYSSQKKDIEQAEQHNLYAISQLKVDQIVQWRQQHLKFAEVINSDSAFIRDIQQWMNDDSNSALKQQMIARMKVFQEYGQYENIVLIDKEENVRLTLAERNESSSDYEKTILTDALRKRQPFLSDLHRAEITRTIYLDLIIPLSSPDSNNNDSFAVLYLQINPDTFLFPFIQSWPTPSRTAETLLVRREQKDVLYLNELRHKKDTALVLRFPLDRKDITAVMAILGQEGVVEGNDYSGARVLAALQKIPESPWYIVAKIDTEEIYQPIHERMMAIFTIMTMLIVAGAGGLIIAWLRLKLKIKEKINKELHQMQKRNERLTRLSLVLGNIDQAVIRIKNEQELLDTMCRIAVEKGSFVAAWIGFYDSIENCLKQSAYYGTSEHFMDDMGSHLKANPEKFNPMHYVVQTRKSWICNDILHDPQIEHCHEIARAYGCRSCAMFPIICSEERIGIISLHAEESFFFDEEEVSLLKEMSDDIAFALDYIEKEQQRLLIEKKLRESEERYIALFDRSLDFVYIHDFEGNFIDANAAALEILGYDREEIKSITFGSLLSEDQIPSAHHTIEELQRTGHQKEITEFKLRCKNGEFIFVETKASIIYRDGTPYAIQGIARNITERKRLETQLLQSQKMEAVGRLAGGIAHDFNNILTSMMGYSDMLVKKTKSDDPLHRYAENILNSTKIAADLTNKLLALSRRHAAQAQVLNLNDIINETVTMLKRIIGEHIEIVSLLDHHLGNIKADPAQIDQVIMNLAVNARDAMLQGGHLTLKTTNILLDQEYCNRYPEVNPGKFVMLSISDTGVGMTDEIKSHLFEPFFTTKEKGKGTGLGLSIVYGIIRQNGGHSEVESEPGKGSTFKIFFPQVEESAKSYEPDSAIISMPRGNETILLVEDDSKVRILVSEVLRMAGYTVLEASNGEEAIRLAQQYENKVHLLLTDVIMPQISGPELVRKLSPLCVNMKILFMSGYTDGEILSFSAEDQQIPFLRKPFLPKILAHRVREVLDSP